MKTYQAKSLELANQCSDSLQKVHHKIHVFSIKNGKRLLAKMHHNWKTRSQLQRLNDSQLKDLGLTSSDVYEEVHKPIWK